MFNLPDSEILPLSREHVFYTWSAQAKVNPIAVKRAKGVYFWDVDNKRYLDFNSMTMCVNIGHGDERVIRAMQEQAAELPYAAPGMTTRIRALASKALADITPGGRLSKILFTLGGADANENAIKLARGYTGRFKILTRYRSYHGATMGAMAATGDPRRHAWEPGTMPGVVHFLDPYRYRSTFHRLNPDISEEDFTRDYLNHLEEIIRYEGPETIAAILMESVTGTNGVIIPPEGYMQGVRALCDKYGIVMIADEVMSGFGRTGKWFAVEHWDVVPDIITMAKGLTSAYAPLGAVAMKPEIAAAFDQRVFEGGLTYTSHPVSLAAAVANIHVMREDKLVERAAALGPVLKRMLNDLGEAHPSVGDVRSIGLFGIVELVRDRKTKEPMAPWNGTSPEMAALRKYCLDHGLFLSTHWHTALVIPPLIIDEAQLAEGMSVLSEALDFADEAAK
ncbi:MAG: aminotransferase class III-fold pyridoxal phosphate-dependent enzyme [Anaerolineae bacterium]|jgi:taurine--2-oxoglutarate transaminase|nr:Putrescine--pyruvate aminotransferase [Anaerolineales bacterium]MBW7917968.1 aminotransferase class III-fold pyridoxal phosphate-dependent enzyme [Anaerolineales bacterium]MCC7512169.1 aminotransferase class III-fold pyridoxal phosphate-dependent enzyme [Anaerolineae bacterium]MCZ2288274.1 aminotransferase class III-fold pyridoxal phosphate-dependent enzyme [Anaerolineales bacterium]OQY80229.1 MAG: aspartate aminotransferase family protein [Anaerolineae bacterium UTCFX3]